MKTLIRSCFIKSDENVNKSWQVLNQSLTIIVNKDLLLTLFLA